MAHIGMAYIVMANSLPFLFSLLWDATAQSAAGTSIFVISGAFGVAAVLVVPLIVTAPPRLGGKEAPCRPTDGRASEGQCTLASPLLPG